MSLWDFSPPPPPPILTPPLESATLPPVPTPSPSVAGEGGSPPPPEEPPSPAGVSPAPEPLTAPSQDPQEGPQAPLPATITASRTLHPIPGFLDGRQAHMFSGSSGAGKTTWIGWFMAEFLRKGSIFGHPCTPPPFMAYIAGDRTIYDALDKLERAGWHNPAHYSLVNDPSPVVDTYLATLRKGGRNATVATMNFFDYVLKNLQERYFPSASRIPVDSLIWIDGMAPFFGIEPAGTYMKSVAAPFITLNRFCDKFAITVCLVHHASKQKTDAKYQRAQDRALGSVAVQGFTSTQMSLTEPELTDTPESGITVFEWRPHSAPHEAHDFRRSRETGLFEYIGPHWDTPTIHPSAPEASLLPFIVDHEWTSTPAIKAVSGEIPKATFYRWLDKLVSAGLVDRDDREGGIAWYRRRVFPKPS